MERVLAVCRSLDAGGTRRAAMDSEALSALPRAVRSRETEQRIILFGSAAFLVSLANAVPAELDFDPTLDADLLLDPDDEATQRGLDAALGSGSAYDTATGFHGDFVDHRISRDFFPPGWPARLVSVSGFDGVFALSTGDNAAAKLLATASSRLNRRLGGAAADRGSKDIRTVAALLRAGVLRDIELSQRVEVHSDVIGADGGSRHRTRRNDCRCAEVKRTHIPFRK